MQLIVTSIPDLKIIVPKRHADARGWFRETWNAKTLARLGIEATFVQDNQARSLHRGTVRGLHFQIEPAAQGKLIWVTRGAIFDVAVDIRPGSANFGRHGDAELTAENGHQLWVPAGFAHGYCTLEDDTEVQYKVTDYYNPAHERGIAWNDPDLAIRWPVAPKSAHLSDRDACLPRLRDAFALARQAE